MAPEELAPEELPLDEAPEDEPAPEELPLDETPEDEPAPEELPAAPLEDEDVAPEELPLDETAPEEELDPDELPPDELRPPDELAPDDDVPLDEPLLDDPPEELCPPDDAPASGVELFEESPLEHAVAASVSDPRMASRFKLRILMLVTFFRRRFRDGSRGSRVNTHKAHQVACERTAGLTLHKPLGTLVRFADALQCHERIDAAHVALIARSTARKAAIALARKLHDGRRIRCAKLDHERFLVIIARRARSSLQRGRRCDDRGGSHGGRLNCALRDDHRARLVIARIRARLRRGAAGLQPSPDHGND